MAKPQEPLDDLVSDQELERILGVTRVPKIHQSAARERIQAAVEISYGRSHAYRRLRYSRIQKAFLRRVARLSDCLREDLWRANFILGSPGSFHFYAFATMDSNWYGNEDDDDDFDTVM